MALEVFIAACCIYNGIGDIGEILVDIGEILVKFERILINGVEIDSIVRIV